MTAIDFDMGKLRAWIGREEHASEALTSALVSRFNATFNQGGANKANPSHAPRLIHWCLTQPIAMSRTLGGDGHPQKGGFLPPVPLPRRIWAGGSLVFKQDARVGSEIARISRIADIALKGGRTGPLCFVTVQHTIRSDGAVLVGERQDIVYRDANGASPPQTKNAPSGQFCQRIALTTPLLFRYSALTFNGHRIRYDYRYAMAVEGYGGSWFMALCKQRYFISLQHSSEASRRAISLFEVNLPFVTGSTFSSTRKTKVMPSNSGLPARTAL
jgi:3-methylfumaryl-CoA hydratase